MKVLCWSCASVLWPDWLCSSQGCPSWWERGQSCTPATVARIYLLKYTNCVWSKDWTQLFLPACSTHHHTTECFVPPNLIPLSADYQRTHRPFFREQAENIPTQNNLLAMDMALLEGFHLLPAQHRLSCICRQGFWSWSTCAAATDPGTFLLFQNIPRIIMANDNYAS